MRGRARAPEGVEARDEGEGRGARVCGEGRRGER